MILSPPFIMKDLPLVSPSVNLSEMFSDSPICHGWLRSDGQKGIRNHIAVVYTVECAEHVARLISAPFKNVQLFGYDGCHCNDFVKRVFSSLITHPNLFGVVVVSLGCEMLDGNVLVEEAKNAGREAFLVKIQTDGGTTGSVRKGRKYVRNLFELSKSAPRCPFFISDLRIGTNCGGSDATSGLSSNPAVGIVYDKIIDAGGTCFFDEITEMIGCSEMAAGRSSKEVSEKIREAVSRAIFTALNTGGEFGIVKGNAEGGLSSIEEKSLGAYMKSGHRNITDVIRVGERPVKPGLYLIDSIPDDITRGVSPVNDTENMCNAAAAGSHITLFTTGRGTPAGSALVPVLKICGSPETCRIMKDNIDIDVSDVLFGETTIEKAGERILSLIIETSKGKLTSSEILGHKELHLHIMNQKHVSCSV